MNVLSRFGWLGGGLLPLAVCLCPSIALAESGDSPVSATAPATPAIVAARETETSSDPIQPAESITPLHPTDELPSADSLSGVITLPEIEAISVHSVPVVGGIAVSAEATLTTGDMSPDQVADAASPYGVEPEPFGIAQNAALAQMPAPVEAPEPAEPASDPEVTSPTEPTAKPDEETSDPNQPATEQPSDLSPNQRQQLFIQGDRLWLQGRYEEAEFLYRKAKNPFQAVSVGDRPEPIYDPEQLTPAGRVYWREAEAGQGTNLTTRMTVPLGLLTEQYPEFIPGNIRYAEVLVEQEQPEEALRVLERAATLYPNEPELIRARVTTLAAQEQYLEASIAARQYAVLNPDAAEAPEFAQLADENLQRFESTMRRRITGNAIANVLTGAISYAVTGGFIGPLSAIQTSVLLLRGESAVGEGAAERISRRVELVEDEAVVAYVNELGQRLARVSGRDEFEYEFYVIQDDDLNAFALPGGKIFVNAGAILSANSEAEFAGLISHELAHAVLSHGFQLMTRGNATANLLDIVPYGGLAANLAVLSYSRDMERQADALGTRMLATAGFAADGLRNLMVTLEEQERYSPPFAWLSTHPDTDERIRNMELQIEQNGYNRYAYEGVERHLEMQERIRQWMEGAEEAETVEDTK